MHKSRLSTFVIDCKVGDVNTAAEVLGEGARSAVEGAA
jgi:hypothetical protein